ncbi:YjbH domain-containing protein [Motilimonas sp. E26]|uniref:YjbH domain-containing protein n=1 Tax=Motilimonas sp. E26 TaxID=2865674 RepID=UPI001E47EB5E|nr:YjbH domain-containing protein [Motilimonas sp. E26]MCE0558581.1 YjbH domain-containing protein [Motilimonas sp. E26]
MFKSKLAYALPLSFFCVSASLADDVKSAFAQTGFSGLLRTPHAQVLTYGDISFNYHIEQRIDHSTSYHDGSHKTLLLGLGIFPYTEFTVQNTFKRFNGETGWNEEHSSDLSFSAKYDFGHFIPEEWFSLALGFQDYGGAATHHKNAYAVASKSLFGFRVSAGWGQGSDRNQMGIDYLDGPFGGIEYQAFDWLQLVSDYDGTGVNAGVKLFTPNDLLPYGWQANLTWQAYSNSDTANRDNQWVGLGLRMPLSGSNKAERYSDNTVQAWADERSVAELQANHKTSTSKEQSQQWQGDVSNRDVAALLSAELVEQGFENISVALEGDSLNLAFENNVFNWNELDGLGVALGILSKLHNGRFDVYLLNNKIPVLRASGHAETYRAFLNSKGKHPSKEHGLTFSTANLANAMSTVAWQHPQYNNGAYRARLILAPSFYSTVGTEMGVMDYSLALSTNLQMQLWQGGVLDVRHLLPLMHSDDYADGEYFANSRHKSEIDRALVHQAFGLPSNVLTQFSAGLVRRHFVGAMNETRWQSAKGNHRFSAEFGYLDHNEKNLTATPMLINYRYYVEKLDWALEAGGGEYWYGDKGFTLASKHWFGDTSVTIKYQDTDEKFAGLSFSVPITLTKDMNPSYVQVRGIDEWSLSYRTMVGNDACNCLNGSMATTTGLQHNLARVYDNRDRLSDAYLRTNIMRLKAAYWLYAH